MITNTLMITIMGAALMALGATAFSPLFQAVAPEEVESPSNAEMAESMRTMARVIALNDLDNDSIANCEDPDDDGDGINDTADEYPHDHDNDGIPDWMDCDDDNDGINDTEDSQGYVGNTSEIERMMKHIRQRMRHHKGHGMDGDSDRMMRAMERRIKQQGMQDLDGDSIANCEDPDDDGDGINDTADEYPHDPDNNGHDDENHSGEYGHHGGCHGQCDREKRHQIQ